MTITDYWLESCRARDKKRREECAVLAWKCFWITAAFYVALGLLK